MLDHIGHTEGPGFARSAPDEPGWLRRTKVTAVCRKDFDDVPNNGVGDMMLRS